MQKALVLLSSLLVASSVIAVVIDETGECIGSSGKNVVVMAPEVYFNSDCDDDNNPISTPATLPTDEETMGEIWGSCGIQ